MDSLKRDLQQAIEIKLKMNATFITTGCCTECEKLANTILPLEEVVKSQPLPHPDCTREQGCICCYGFHPLRDENGRLIKSDYSFQ